MAQQGTGTTPARPEPPVSVDGERRRRVTRRAIPLAVIAGVAFVIGLVVGGGYVPAEQKLADQFGQAWERGNLTQMRALTSAQTQDRVSAAAFATAYRTTQDTATQSGLTVGKAPEPQNGVVKLPVKVRTRLFGVVAGTVAIPFDGDGDGTRIAWAPQLTFPGLESGQTLRRQTELPPRTALLAVDGQVLAKGPDRTSPIPTVADEIVGEVGPAPPEDREKLRAEGVPDGADVGLSGLERVFQTQLAGTPGGRLLAGRRTLARATARKGRAVRTTIVPKLEESAITALGGRSGGITVMKPTGQIQALAGQAFSILQPPGSTFKIITTAAALDAGVVKIDSEFPIQTSANIEGFLLSNAGGEACGGKFEEAFAESCNSVFAPLGVKVGAKRLVQMAEKFGFNGSPGIPGAERSQIPSAETIGGDLDVGSSAIGQGKVQSTALQMASAGASVATGGLRYPPTLDAAARPKPTRIMRRSTAITMRRLMVGVVKSGTGKAAQINGVKVAGKTGTAELGGGLTDDAWFVAFAPAIRPKIVVGVLLVQAGFGGDVAAPAAHDVLVKGLGK